MTACLEIDDAERVTGIRVPAMNAVPVDRHIGASGFRHDEELVQGALKTVEHLLRLVGRRVDEQDLGVHLVDADHSLGSSVSRHDAGTSSIAKALISTRNGKWCREGR